MRGAYKHKSVVIGNYKNPRALRGLIKNFSAIIYIMIKLG